MRFLAIRVFDRQSLDKLSPRPDPPGNVN